jgi:DNA-binding SARP family transcriptional activator
VLDYRILGPLEVADGERTVALGGVGARAVLAVLVVSANRSVSTGVLIDEVWSGRAPATAANVVQGHVSDLRRVLGRDAVETRDEGHRFVIPRGGRDLDRFEQLAAEGSEALAAGQAERAAEAFAAALALWRGPALAEVAAEGTLVAEALRLDELRLSALERRIEADLAAARHRDLVAELQSLVTEHPHREPLRASLALALYRSGRSVEALDVLREARRALAEQLGLDPGPALQELERAILRHDPELAAPEQSRRRGASAPAERAVMATSLGDGGIAAVTALAAAAAAASGRELIVTRLVERSDELAEAASGMNDLRDRLVGEGITARAAAFTSADPAADTARLLRNHDVDLLLLEAPPDLLADPRTQAILAAAPCDVGLLVGTPADGPVVVPFSGGRLQAAPAAQLGAQVAALDEAHGDVDVPVGLAGRVDRDHVGVVDARRELRLLQDPRARAGIVGERGREHLERHGPGQAQIRCPEHLAHAAAADQALDRVVRDRVAGRQLRFAIHASLRLPRLPQPARLAQPADPSLTEAAGVRLAAGWRSVPRDPGGADPRPSRPAPRPRTRPTRRPAMALLPARRPAGRGARSRR